ncbi:MAG: hypothetical protein NC116_11515 [Clostridium sp.]|nr:hypothetical protein [Clostridium sp.]
MDVSAPEYLSELLREAHRDYLDQVTSNRMTLRVFALQFIARHHFGRSTTVIGKNIHNEALCTVRLLLTERHDLVAIYFKAPVLSDMDIENIINLIYSESSIRENGEPVILNPLSCTLTDEDWPVITDCVNKAQLFQTEISEEELKNLLLCTLKEPLRANNLQGICYLFDSLSIAAFITGRWQTPLADSDSILSNRTNKTVTSSNYSSTLSRMKGGRHTACMTDIDLLIDHLCERNVTKQ